MRSDRVVNYPSGHGPQRKKVFNKQINYASRGMSLEERLNESNQYYLTKDLAVIHKKPTPIQVVKVNYPRRSAARITEAYYRQASTTDYNGVYKGHYIDFEAKETKNVTSFPLANLPQHQRDHMLNCIKHGGISFLILSFNKLNEIYLIPYEKIASYLQQTDKQSIPYDYIVENGFVCKTGVFPMIDYLEALNQYLVNRERK